MTTYMQERWRDVWSEMSPLWLLHWEEVAIHRDYIKLDPDVAEYQRIEDAGQLQLVAVREAGRLIAYHISFVKPHIHYKPHLHAFVDVYYVLPEFRVRPLIAKRMFDFAENLWQRRKVQKAYTGTKTWGMSPITGKSLDVGPLLEFQGWHQIETVYTKVYEYA